MSQSKIQKFGDTIVTVKPNSHKEIAEGELIMKLNRCQNENGLARNIV